MSGAAAGASVEDAEQQTKAWDEHKRAERAARGESDTSALAGISRGLPEWQRAEFAAVAANPGDAAARDRLEDEIGDILFVCANLARHAKVDFGAALRRANHKFERRFRAMEALAEADGGLAGQSLEAQDRYWVRAKQAERTGEKKGDA